MADTIGILLTTEFLEEEDVDEVEDYIFPFLLNNHLFRKKTFRQFKDFMKKLFQHCLQVILNVISYF